MLYRFGIIFLVWICISCKKQTPNFEIIERTQNTAFTDICRKSLYWPELSSGTLKKNIVNKINRSLKEFLEQIQVQAERNFHFSDSLASCKKSRKGASYDIGYKKTFQSSSVLSFLFDIDFQSESAAHGLHLYHGISFSLIDGSVLKPYPFKCAEGREGYEAAYFNAFKKFTSDPSNCAISPEKIPKPSQALNTYFDGEMYKIVFNPYEIAPYACSTIEIGIPLSEISPFFSEFSN